MIRILFFIVLISYVYCLNQWTFDNMGYDSYLGEIYDKSEVSIPPVIVYKNGYTMYPKTFQAQTLTLDYTICYVDIPYYSVVDSNGMMTYPNAKVRQNN